jgi:hypothetical protein
MLGPPSFDDGAVNIEKDETVVIDLICHASSKLAEPNGDHG